MSQGDINRLAVGGLAAGGLAAGVDGQKRFSLIINLEGRAAKAPCEGVAGASIK